MWGGSYQPGTLIWRSRWVTGDAIIECHEALALPARHDRAVILRRVIAQHGTARAHIDLNPRAGFGHHPLTKLAQAGDRTWTARTADVHLAWRGGSDANPHSDGRRGQTLTLDLELPEGSHHDFVLVLSSKPSPSRRPTPSAPGGPPSRAEWWWQWPSATESVVLLGRSSLGRRG